LRTAEALGMPPLEARLRALETPPPSPARAAPYPLPCRLVHEGDFWTVCSDGFPSRIRDSKGMRYLRALLGNPGQEFHVLALVADVDGTRGGPAGAARMSDGALARLGHAPRAARRP